MKLPWQQATWEGSIKANIALSYTALIMSIIALVVVFNAAQQKERIVFTPVVIDKTMSVGWVDADEDYTKAFALSVAQMVGNLTPQNAMFVVDSMSQFMHSSIYPDLRQKILAVADTRQFREVAGATRYLPSNVIFERDTNKVFVVGAMEVATATGREKRGMIYEMTIKIESGRPMIYSFNNYDDVPHTKEWHLSHPDTEKTEGAAK